MADDPDAGTTEPDGLASRLSRMAFGPARAAARSGREALTTEAERAIEGLLAGPVPETVARSLVEHHVVERAVAEWLESMTAHPEPSPDRERLVRAFERALANPAFEQRVDEVAERVIRSASFKRALSGVLESPEVRSALARQTAGFSAEIGASVRGSGRRLDDRTEATARRILGRRPSATAGYGGVATRGLALTIDLVLAHAAYLFIAGSVALIASLAGDRRSGWLADSIAAAGWAIVVLTYFVVFWSSTGQTPGMRLMRLRVLAESSGTPPSVWRSIIRFVGLVLAIAPMLLGFVPALFDRRRRALQDYVARTTVRTEP